MVWYVEVEVDVSDEEDDDDAAAGLVFTTGFIIDGGVLVGVGDGVVVTAPKCRTFDGCHGMISPSARIFCWMRDHCALQLDIDRCGNRSAIQS